MTQRSVSLVGRSGTTARKGLIQMRIATDTITNYLAVEVFNFVRAEGGAALDSLVEQGWSLARIDAYSRRGAELVAA